MRKWNNYTNTRYEVYAIKKYKNFLDSGLALTERPLDDKLINLSGLYSVNNILS